MHLVFFSFYSGEVVEVGGSAHAQTYITMKKLNQRDSLKCFLSVTVKMESVANSNRKQSLGHKIIKK